jgi:hypothetical protein
MQQKNARRELLPNLSRYLVLNQYYKDGDQVFGALTEFL